MKFVVRYWSSRLPVEYRGSEGKPRWLDYSVHPASKLGLHNALLAVHDRLEILEAHGGSFGCAVFVVEDGSAERLSQEAANSLFASLPRGEVKWLDIGRFLLPEHPPAPLSAATDEALPQAQQLPLFAHTHTPYDDLDETPHTFDIDI
jgi:hypothetical protein